MEGRGSAAGHLAVVAMVLVLVMAPGALAANHVVGGTTQKWDFPPTNDQTYYTSWAANQTFAVGDTLQFEYTASHDVVQYATVAEYNACAGTAVNTYTTGNTSITLANATTYYFICSIPGHCTEGMKVAVTVGAVAPASPPTTTPSPPGTTPPTAPWDTASSSWCRQLRTCPVHGWPPHRCLGGLSCIPGLRIQCGVCESTKPCTLEETFFELW